MLSFRSAAVLTNARTAKHVFTTKNLKIYDSFTMFKNSLSTYDNNGSQNTYKTKGKKEVFRELFFPVQ